MKEIENKFNPKDFEDKIYQRWEDNENFKPTMDKKKKGYSIVMPPPNVTGKLHMGHALDAAIQDSLIRTKRMQGCDALWLPGTDHASIATEAKVVAKMKEEGITKADVGREGFLERAWDWTKQYGGTIQKQQRKLGASCDWSRTRFTLDEGLSKAVITQFINMYNDGLIYRGKKMINWCPTCHTTISNAEVEYEERPSHLWHIRYKIVGANDANDANDTNDVNSLVGEAQRAQSANKQVSEAQYVEVATTRPETMLGDTAVAVNPKDERYKNIIGKKCILPIIGREIPIIADEFVDVEFGTGCVKVTPAHDPNDYEAGKRHDLEVIEVFDESSKMLNIWPEVEGMTTEEAREKVVEELKKEGALISIEDYTHNVGTCYRCHGVVEPRISEQWFVAMKELAKPAIEAVEKGNIKFVPKKYEKTYFNWLYNIQDWCISRQLWWGHRIPAYYCQDCGHIEVAESKPNKCSQCSSTKLVQDQDTLDTWFSSALWPFSTMGWPDTDSEDFKKFFPTDVLVTGYDIIFFWVVRMVFSSYYSTGEKPFSDIVIHGLVRDSQGRKMSKSLGNGIDPLDIVEQYGADALRFSLLSGTTMGNDIKYMPEKLDQASNFANKIWNAAKFVINSCKDIDNSIIERHIINGEVDWQKALSEAELSTVDKWIIGRTDELIADVTNNVEKYDLGIAVDNLYSFIWNEFCDWYIEISKTEINSNQSEKQIAASITLQYTLRILLKLLHPFMPFVTTEIYEHLKNDDEKELMISAWPTKIVTATNVSTSTNANESISTSTNRNANESTSTNMNVSTKTSLNINSKSNANANVKSNTVEIEYSEAIEFVEKIKNIIVKVRNIRTTMNVHPSKKVKLIFVVKTKTLGSKLNESKEFIKRLAFGEEVIIQETNDGIADNAISVAEDEINLYMPFDELVDIEEEKVRLQKEKEKLEAEVKRSNGILSNQGFLAKAPEEKVKQEKEKLEKYTQMLTEIEIQLAKLGIS